MARIEVPVQFFLWYAPFTTIELDRDLNPDWVSPFEFDLEVMRGDVLLARDEATREGELEELRAMLEFLASGREEDAPTRAGMCVLVFTTAAMSDKEINHLGAWARSVVFPDLPPMTEADKKAAVARVEITQTPLEEWRKRRRGGASSEG